jgi:hypothetical protein
VVGVAEFPDWYMESAWAALSANWYSLTSDIQPFSPFLTVLQLPTLKLV